MANRFTRRSILERLAVGVGVVGLGTGVGWAGFPSKASGAVVCGNWVLYARCGVYYQCGQKKCYCEYENRRICCFAAPGPPACWTETQYLGYYEYPC